MGREYELILRKAQGGVAIYLQICSNDSHAASVATVGVWISQRIGGGSCCVPFVVSASGFDLRGNR